MGLHGFLIAAMEREGDPCICRFSVPSIPLALSSTHLCSISISLSSSALASSCLSHSHFHVRHYGAPVATTIVPPDRRTA